MFKNSNFFCLNQEKLLFRDEDTFFQNDIKIHLLHNIECCHTCLKIVVFHNVFRCGSRFYSKINLLCKTARKLT